MPAFYHLNFVLLDLSTQVSVFSKLCITNSFLDFLLCRSCRWLKKVSLGGPCIACLGLIKRYYFSLI